MPTQDHHPSLLTRLLISQPPSTLRALRSEIAADLERAQEGVRTLRAELREVEHAIAEREGQTPEVLFGDQYGPKPPLKTAVLVVLDEEPNRVWDREELFGELETRGWGPGGA